MPWKLSASIASRTVRIAGSGSYVDLDRRRPAARGLERLAEHPADGVAVVPDLVGEQRLVVLDAGVVDAGDVCSGEHPDDAGDVVRRRWGRGA